MKKYIKAFVFFLPDLFIQNINNDMKIIAYKIIQTGMKTQSGGDKNGLFKLLYHSMFFII